MDEPLAPRREKRGKEVCNIDSRVADRASWAVIKKLLKVVLAQVPCRDVVVSARDTRSVERGCRNSNGCGHQGESRQGEASHAGLDVKLCGYRMRVCCEVEKGKEFANSKEQEAESRE